MKVEIKSKEDIIDMVTSQINSTCVDSGEESALIQFVILETLLDIRDLLHTISEDAVEWRE